jgi:hypothetical protein
MPMFEIHFTVAEARAAIPEVRRRILRIQNLLAEIRARQTEAGQATAVILRGNGKGPIIAQAVDDAQKQEAQKLIEGIAAEGIQIKDLQTGLIDFPHFLAGDPDHEVFLCWHLGEDTIQFWHEIEDGYAGRRPI